MMPVSDPKQYISSISLLFGTGLDVVPFRGVILNILLLLSWRSTCYFRAGQVLASCTQTGHADLTRMRERARLWLAYFLVYIYIYIYVYFFFLYIYIYLEKVDYGIRTKNLIKTCTPPF